VNRASEDGGKLVLQPKRLDKRARLAAANARTVRNHRDALRKLAK
jgi:hypothetical protein